MFIQGSSLSMNLTGTNQTEKWEGGSVVGGGGGKIALTWVIYRLICVLV